MEFSGSTAAMILELVKPVVSLNQLCVMCVFQFIQRIVFLPRVQLRLVWRMNIYKSFPYILTRCQTSLFVKPLLQDKWVDLYIYDLNGKIKQISFGKNEISVAGLSNGIYVLQVRDGEKIQSYKFVKN
jgi:hypothetical protein